MVTSTRSAGRLMIVARPNQSASWRSNLYVLLAISVPSLGAAIGFTAMGAWPILPFAGLELLALAAALYYVNWKLQYRHVITLSEDSIRIDKGHYHPRQSWQFRRQVTGLSVIPEKHPWESPALTVHDRQQRVSVGEFLNRDDALALLELLRKEIRVDSYSATGDRHF
ncbi:DUF2244 domain-containing protein [Pseudohalioglobus sediminis]|uniref:DUF2244 domain-containing protein n=1 Tax=Pseudohalioglobus sediminis TaxID=2606449 RepID=A0A5B0X700_9GAMM|nr:DUF2244 domain-containing protein [Pseudohalioglobus sediminis]KAA1194415.1 DUF2244 domain-containing protein [Pseudohalioglobus sediminis]